VVGEEKWPSSWEAEFGALWTCKEGQCDFEERNEEKKRIVMVLVL
jgi:hypothetical protein